MKLSYQRKQKTVKKERKKLRTEKCEREREKERERRMREVVTLEWDNWRVNKREERDKGENHRKRSQERAKGNIKKGVRYNSI